MAKAFLAHAVLLGSSYVIASAVPPAFSERSNGRHVTDCALWQEFTARSSEELLREISTTSEDFRRLNPNVELSGETLISGRHYCLMKARAASSPSSKQRQEPSNKLLPRSAFALRRTPGKNESKILQELELCRLKHRIQRGDSCKSVQKFYDLSFEDLYKWNPMIGKRCQFFPPGACVCVTEPTGVLNYGLSGISTP
ncbi:hypothetical protein CP532_1905 [Ophiocordyceps camponoti-leonardi (nom. inval.)]|nr:hypothetical protein CP532_1905 [Ophiocordyceps camponoti-leonardi (nom. inval.)]